ncbi:ceramide glucosyltransferase-like [Crassostrea virginica]|uniref:ceramide glucosyltransferase n=1 Tax=Crassostrea virginica TaxID=6565 RepID=A0A8B8ELA3_CRAVI|nr:ceramide glucosyltransferase-like [Crassostrea virginica]
MSVMSHVPISLERRTHESHHDNMSVAHYFAFSLAIFILGGWCFVWFMHILALIYGKYRLHHPIPPPSPEDLQGVSIIKPLVGVDPNLYFNLESFFTTVYPSFELLFCLQDESDPALMVVKALMEKYPKVDAKIFIGVKYVGPNGKVNNMCKAYEAAKYDMIVISDSSILMKPDSLMDMMSFMKSDVGLVLQMPYCCTRKGFAAVYEKVYFGTFQSRNCLSANSVGINCSTGMSCLFRKDILEKSGGLAPLGKYLAEDYFISENIRKEGYRTVLCSQPAQQNSGQYSMGHFHQRLIRWSQLRISLLPHLILFEPLSECMLMGVIASWAAEYIFGISSMGFFLMHVLVWFLFDYTLLTCVENGPLPFSKFEFLVAWILREVLSIWMTIQSHKTSIVQWRHKKYRVLWGGTIEELV